MFSSAMCRRYNFTDAPYWIRFEGDTTHFLAEPTSPTDGRMVWQGSIVGGELSGQWVEGRLATHLTPSTEPAVHRAVMVAVVLYVVLMALPFLPSVEIGLTLIAMFGAKIVLMVYGATVLALCCSFAMGRLLPESTAARVLDGLRLEWAAAAIRRLEALPRDQRLQVLVRNAPSRIVPFLLRHQ